MIRCNLAVLLAERNMRISELSRRTGISRTTLTALSSNQSKGIQFDTFDTICDFLKVSPNDLFIQELLEYDFTIKNSKTNDSSYGDIELIIQAEVTHKSELINENFFCNVNAIYDSFARDFVEVQIHPQYSKNLLHVFKSIPVPFKTSMEEELKECIKTELILNHGMDENIDYNLH